MSKWKETRLAGACRLAAEDLGLEFISPYEIVNQRSGKRTIISGVFRFIGKAKGTAIIAAEDPPGSVDAARSEGLYVTLLGDAYLEYEREHFVEAFIDWGWHGDPAKRPSWLKVRVE